jgi:peroxiredoxin Q/BCP
MLRSTFVSHFRNALFSLGRVSLCFSPITQKNWFCTLGVVIGVVAVCGFGIRAHAAADTVQAGAVAPNFTLPSQEDKPVSLTDYKGKWVVLYFYPKDQTKGCTLEAHGFQRDIAKYDAMNAVVLGVSVDTVADHKTWCSKDTFSFKLLADPDHKVVDAYGVPLMTYKEMKFANRQTFLISPDGKVVKVWPRVDDDIPGQSTAVLAEITADKK